jgi:Predicted transcriptional regulator
VDIQSLHENSIIALPQKEQGLVWLVQNGPLVANPPLPVPVLRSLTHDERILRLRKGLYLVPSAEGRLPRPAQTAGLVAPDGYISGQAALMLHGLTDQDIGRWFVVTARRQADIRYGYIVVHFVLSPAVHATGQWAELSVSGEPARVATVAQAIVDELRFSPFGLDYVAMTSMVRTAFELKRTTARELRAVLDRKPSVAVARRLGLVIELATGKRDATLQMAARSQRGVTRTHSDRIAEPAWRLVLPRSRNDILRASR